MGYIAVQYLKDLFQMGMETWSPNAQSGNLGGAKFYLKKNFPDRGIVFNRQDFGKAVKDFGGYCWTFNKVLLKGGKPVFNKASTYPVRVLPGILLWNPRDSDGQIAKKYASKMKQDFLEIADRIICGLDAIEAGVPIHQISKLRKPGWIDEYDNIKPQGCIFICVPAMAADNELGYWTNQATDPKETKDRYIPEVGTSDIEWDL